MLIIYFILLFCLGVYSYALMDPNITFFQHQAWVSFREWIIMFGYYQRINSSYVFMSFVILLFAFQFYFYRIKKVPSIMKLLIGICLLGILSYPFLSHDLFNYMFDAKIVTVYHQNPYLHKALDFPQDPWLRFMHWTHRTYPYGPTFLVLSLIPSALSFGKFFMGFLFYKGMNAALYVIAGLLLHTINKRAAVFYATSPLIIIEGLINAHNDMIAVSLALIGIYFVIQKRTVAGRILLLFSAGIKYITAPAVLISAKNNRLNHLAFGGIIILLGYLSYTSEIQPWYFLSLMIFISFYPVFFEKITLFTAGLILSYYPYVRFGGWDKQWKVNIKHEIILVFFILNLVYLLYEYRLLLWSKLRRHSQNS